MKIINGIAYAQTEVQPVTIIAVKPLEDMMLLLTFNNHEERLFDASALLEMPVFQPIKEQVVFAHPVLEDGVVTWLDGAIDIAPETMYQQSYRYDRHVG